MRITLPMEIVSLDSHSYHLFLKASVGETEIDILIDTGASRTVFDPLLIVEEPFESEMQLQTAGISAEALPMTFGRIPQLFLGDWEIRNLSVAAMDFSKVNEWYARYAERKISALMGSDFLLAHKAVIDYRRSCVTFSVPHSQLRKGSMQPDSP